MAHPTTTPVECQTERWTVLPKDQRSGITVDVPQYKAPMADAEKLSPYWQAVLAVRIAAIRDGMDAKEVQERVTRVTAVHCDNGTVIKARADDVARQSNEEILDAHGIGE